MLKYIKFKSLSNYSAIIDHLTQDRIKIHITSDAFVGNIVLGEHRFDIGNTSGLGNVIALCKDSLNIEAREINAFFDDTSSLSFDCNRTGDHRIDFVFPESSGRPFPQVSDSMSDIPTPRSCYSDYVKYYLGIPDPTICENLPVYSLYISVENAD